MTDEEIAKGKMIYMRVNSVYRLHPEYKKAKELKFDFTQDRYEQFIQEMSEKYGESKQSIKNKIHRS